MDATVALTARVADEMLERGVVLGLTAKWLADRSGKRGSGTRPTRRRRAQLLRRGVRVRGVGASVTSRERANARASVSSGTESGDWEAKTRCAGHARTRCPRAEMSPGRAAVRCARARVVFKRQAEDVVESRTSPAVAAETRAFDNILRGKDVKDFWTEVEVDSSSSRNPSPLSPAGASSAPSSAASRLICCISRISAPPCVDSSIARSARTPQPRARPPNANHSRAQTAAFGQMIRRKKQRMGRDVIDAMQRDPSVSRDVNILFQEVVRKTKSVENVDETSAVDEVLLSVSDYGAELDARGDGEDISYAEKMRGALERLSVALDDFEPPERRIQTTRSDAAGDR